MQIVVVTASNEKYKSKKPLTCYIRCAIMELREALEKISDINAQLLKNSLKPNDDLLVLEAQEIAIEALS